MIYNSGGSRIYRRRQVNLILWVVECEEDFPADWNSRDLPQEKISNTSNTIEMQEALN